MNSPLENREVRRRGLPQRRRPLCTRVVPRRFERPVHKDGVRQELSAQADIAFS
jgi:hypothetical protein